MPSRFDPMPIDEVDCAKPYDIYVLENQKLHVYRNAYFQGLKDLLRRQQHDFAADFTEIRQSNGQSVFVRRSSVVKFCDPGVELIAVQVRPNA